MLLDEVGEMPLDMQVKLLRFLQSRNFERVGGTKSLLADVRVLAATNRDLAQAVNLGGFRQDLYYRLNVIHLQIPPLRERPGDIPLLAEHFLRIFAAKFGSPAGSLAPGAVTQLMNHDWPGNVRELEHTMERTVLLTQTEVISQIYLSIAPPPASGREPAPALASPEENPANLDLNQYPGGLRKKVFEGPFGQAPGAGGRLGQGGGGQPQDALSEDEPPRIKAAGFPAAEKPGE